MAVAARILLWSLVPVITTLVALLTAIFTFVGSNGSNSAATRNIFFYGIDFSQVFYPLDSSNWTSVADAAGMDPIFRIGAGGYCYGDSSQSSDLSCVTPSTPFWFDLRSIMGQYGAQHTFDKSDTLEQLQVLPFEVNSKCVWALLIAVIIVSAICLVLFLLDMFYPLGAFSTILLLGSVIQTACAISAAVLALQNYTNLRSVLTAGIIRGNTGLGLIWSMAAMSILSLAWWFVSCCGKCQRARRDPYQEEEGEKVNEGGIVALKQEPNYVGGVGSDGSSAPIPQESTRSASTRYNSFSSAPSLPDRASSLSVSRVDMSHIGPHNSHKSPRSSRVDLTRGQTLQRRRERGISQTPQVQLLNPYRNRIPEHVDEGNDSCGELQRKVTMKKFKTENGENDSSR